MLRRTLFTLCLLVPLPVAQADDMLSTYTLALQQDQQYQTAIKNYEAQQAALGVARSGLLPFLGANAASLRHEDDVSSPDNVPGFDGTAEYNIDNWSIDFRQPLFDMTAWHTYQQAKANVERAEFNFRAAEQELIFRVVNSYGQALVETSNVAVAQAEKKSLSEQLELDRERLNVGLGTVTDLYASQSRYSLAEASEIESNFALRDAREALRVITGQAPGELTLMADDMPPLEPPQPDSVDWWVDKALKQNLELLAASRAVEVAEREVKRIQAGHLPTLDLVASRANRDTDGSLTGSGRTTDTTDVGVRLNVPLVEGWGVVSGTREARARYEAALSERERIRREVDRSVRAAYDAVKSGISRLLALRAAIKASESNLESKREGYTAGVNTNVEVLDATRDLFSTQRDYAQAVYQFMLSLLRLKQAVGNLQVADLEYVNGWLEGAAMSPATAP